MITDGIAPLPAEAEKWNRLRTAPVRDAADRRLRAVADALWQAALCRPTQFAHLAASAARDCITYQTDTARVGGEELGHPIVAYERGIDDCDAKARLFVALCLARGIRAQMEPKWEAGRLAHVYASVLQDGTWQPVETTLARARVGDAPLTVPKERETGKWKLT